MIQDDELTYADAVRSRTARLLDKADALRQEAARLEAEAARMHGGSFAKAAEQYVDALYAEADAPGTLQARAAELAGKAHRLIQRAKN